MLKKGSFILIILVLLLGLIGCATSAATETATGTSQTVAGAPELTMENKLAAGTLKLEGTDLAVTPEQAKALLPLWKAVKSLNGSDTASADEIQALYDQIQETMTAEQVAAIEAMSLTQEDLRTLMTDLGIDPGFGGMQDADPNVRATQIAQFQAENPGGTFPQDGGTRPSDGGTRPSGGGMMPSGGGTMPSGGGEFPGFQGGNGMQGQDGLQVTPQAGRTGRGGANMMSQIFLSPLITLLEERAGQ